MSEIEAHSAAPPAARRLASWAAALALEHVPPRVVALAVRCALDTVGVMIAGTEKRAARLTRQLVAAAGAAGHATVIGHSDGLHPAAAALANAAAAHALDFDDSCYAGYVHGSAVVFPAVLAVAEYARVSGARCLEGFIAGIEVEYAVGLAATRSLYDRGWFTTALLGSIGAAAGASRVLCLDADHATQAIALAAAGAGSLRGCIGSDAKSYLAGRAAEAGVGAAFLAAAGMTGPEQIFEDRRGFVAAINGGVFDHRALAELGRSWRLETPGVDVKPYPICLSALAAADAAAELVARHELRVEAIEGIRCEVPPVVAINLSYPEPATTQEAQFSMPFAIAALLTFGDIGLAHLTEETLADLRLRALMAKVAMTVDAGWNDDPARASYPEGAEVTLTMQDGRHFRCFNGTGRGAPAKPLSDECLDAKFLACAETLLTPEVARRLLASIRAMPDLPSLATLARDLAAAAPAAATGGGNR